MLDNQDFARLLNKCALVMNTNTEDALTIICACSEPYEDPDEVLLMLSDGEPPPEWFVDTCLDIITGRIPLISVFYGEEHEPQTD